MQREHAAQVPVAHAQLCGQGAQGGWFAAMVDGHVQLLGREFSHQGLRIGGGPKAPRGGQLRAATQTRSEAMGLGLRCRFKKLAIHGARQFHPADRAAINAGGRDAGEKNTVPSGIPFGQGLVAAVRVQAFCRFRPNLWGRQLMAFHEGHVSHKWRCLNVWNVPFSDP